MDLQYQLVRPLGKAGERADNNKFFCNEKGKWEPSPREGEPCQRAYDM